MVGTEGTPPVWQAGDFLAFYSAGLIANTNPEKLYDIDTQRKIEQRLNPSLPPRRHLHYLYPPFFSVLLLLLSHFTYIQAYWIWTTASVVLYLLSIWILILLVPSAKAQFGHILAVSAAAPALVRCIFLGQTTTLGLFFWTLAFYLLKRRRPLWSGMTMGLLTYRFHFLIVMVPVLIIKRLWRTGLGLVIASIALICAGGLFFPFSLYADYLASLSILLAKIQGNHHPLAQYVSLYGFSRLLLPNPLAAGFTLLGVAPLFYWLVRIWRGNVEPHSDAFDLQFAMTITVTPLIMHHSLIYDLMLLTIPALLIYQHRSLFSPYYKLLLALIYFAPYYSFLIAEQTGFNPTQPLLFWLSYEIYRAS
ncbi:MAG: glycosyltransferase family 87 protein, partial [Candidatus Binatia bacterium]